jgi:hypothetical protein
MATPHPSRPLPVLTEIMVELPMRLKYAPFQSTAEAERRFGNGHEMTSRSPKQPFEVILPLGA